MVIIEIKRVIGEFMRRVFSLIISITIFTLFNINYMQVIAGEINIDNYKVDIDEFKISNKE